MNFYNFFTNLNTDFTYANQTLDSVFNLLVDSDGNTYSNEYTPVEQQENLSTIIGPEKVAALNPSVFLNQEDRTLPVLNFLYKIRETSSMFCSTHPAINFMKDFDPTSITYSMRWNGERGYDDQTKLIYGLLSHTSHNYINSLFRNNHSTPNQNFSLFLKLFENTHNISEQYSINPEVHKKLLDEGYVCWVDSLQESETLNNSDQSSSLRSVIQLYVALLKHVIKIKEGEEPEAGSPDSSTDLGKAFWNRLFSIDNNSFFSHIEYQRPTEYLLAFSKEEIENKINMLLSTKIFNYIKMGEVEEINDTTVYTHFSKEFFEKFKENISNPEEKDLNNFIKIKSKPLCLQLFPSRFLRTPDWGFRKIFDDSYSQKVRVLPNDNQPYVPWGGTSGFIFSELDEKFTNLDIPLSLQENVNKRVTGLIFNGFTKATSKAEFEFISLTKKQALIRKGFFIPVLIKFISFDKNCEFKIATNFSLLNYSDSIGQFQTRRRSREQMRSFYLKYDIKGTMIVNFAQYLKEQAEALKELTEYSTINSITFSNYTNAQIDELLSSLAKRKIEANVKASSNLINFSDKITAKLLINPAVQRKYNKVSSHYNKLIEENTSAKETTTQLSAVLENHHSDVDFHLKRLRDLENSILEIKEKISKNNKSVRSNFNKRVDLVKTICLNKNLFLKTEEKYNLAIQQALKQNNYASSSFFQNLSENESIKIISIKANNGADVIDFNINDAELNDSSIQIVSKAKNFVIDEVTFLIDAPVKIKVDGGEKGEVTAGPYYVKVSPSQINIALAYPSSIHGYNELTSSIYIHPHANSTNPDGLVRYFTRDGIRWSKGCLGEASALIYKAFEKNDLKTILISALTWVKNANSADPWGRNYKHFPKYSEMLKNKPVKSETKPLEENNDITEDEVNDFIEAMLEPEILTQEPINTTPVLVPENGQQDNQETNVQEPGIEAFNTNETYIPYTQRQ